MRRHFGAVVCFAVSSCAAPAQTQLDGPDLNFLFDHSAGGIRKIVGIPGSAYLGPPLRPGFPVASLVFSATGRYALAVREADQQVFRVSFAAAEPAYSAIDGLIGAGGGIFISPGGKAAAVCSEECRTVTRVTGLPHAPAIAGSVMLDRASVLSIADNGAILTASARDQGSVLLYSGPDGSTRLIGRAGEIRSIAISGDGSTAVFADAVTSQVVRIDDLPGAAVFTAIAGADQGIADPIGVALSRSGSLGFVAMTSHVLLIDLAGTGAVTRFDCACAISTMENLAGDAILRLTSGADAPVWLLDADHSPPRFVFVPAAKAPQREAVQ